MIFCYEQDHFVPGVRFDSKNLKTKLVFYKKNSSSCLYFNVNKMYSGKRNVSDQPLISQMSSENRLNFTFETITQTYSDSCYSNGLS